MVSFGQLLEELNKPKASPLMSNGEDGRILNVVRVGSEFHEEDETSFWDEFIELCYNSEGLAQLLGVSREKVIGWPAKIKDALDKLERHHAESPSQKVDKEMIPTGDNGAFTPNQDPDLGGI